MKGYDDGKQEEKPNVVAETFEVKKTSLKTNSTPYYDNKQEDFVSDDGGFRKNKESGYRQPTQPANNFTQSNNQTKQYGFTNNSQPTKPQGGFNNQSQGRQFGPKGGFN